MTVQAQTVIPKGEVVGEARKFATEQKLSPKARVTYLALMNFFAGTGAFVPPFMDHIHFILDLREALQVGRSNVYGCMSYDKAHTLITTHPKFEALTKVEA